MCESQRFGYPPFFPPSLQKTLWGGGHLNFSRPSAAGKKTARRSQGTHRSLSEFVEHVVLFGLSLFYVKDDGDAPGAKRTGSIAPTVFTFRLAPAPTPSVTTRKSGSEKKKAWNVTDNNWT